jgi:hypothetical protein
VKADCIANFAFNRSHRLASRYAAGRSGTPALRHWAVWRRRRQKNPAQRPRQTPSHCRTDVDGKAGFRAVRLDRWMAISAMKAHGQVADAWHASPRSPRRSPGPTGAGRVSSAIGSGRFVITHTGDEAL